MNNHLLKKIAASLGGQGDIFTDAGECRDAVASASRLQGLAARLGEGVDTELMTTSLYADGVAVCSGARLDINGSVLADLPHAEWDKRKVWQIGFAPGVLVDLELEVVDGDRALTEDGYLLKVKDEGHFYDLVLAKQKDMEVGPFGAPRLVRIIDTGHGSEIEISLTKDAYDYNDRFFTLEATDGAEEENDADVSGLPVSASQAEIARYLAAAANEARRYFAETGSVRRMASSAARVACASVGLADKKQGWDRDPLATAAGLFDAIKQDLDGLFQHGADGDAIESAYIRAQCGMEAVKAAAARLDRVTAQECAEQYGNSNDDSNFTLDTLRYRNEEYELRVCGAGQSAYFEWIDQGGDPVGDVFEVKDAFVRFKFLSWMANERDALIGLPSDKKPTSGLGM